METLQKHSNGCRKLYKAFTMLTEEGDFKSIKDATNLIELFHGHRTEKPPVPIDDFQDGANIKIYLYEFLIEYNGDRFLFYVDDHLGYLCEHGLSKKAKKIINSATAHNKENNIRLH